MNLKALSDQDLVLKLKIAVSEERRLTTEVLHYLHEADSRLFFAEMSFSSLYEFCVKHLGYSDGSAYRRIQSMRLLESLPSEEQAKTETKIKSGEVSLTNLSVLQSFFKIEKKEGKYYSTEEKANLLSSIENKSKREVEKDLSALQPLIMPKEKTRVVSPELNEIKFIADAKLMDKLTRVKEVLAHVNPNPTYADLLERPADEFLERKDPVVKSERIQKKDSHPYPTKVTKNSPPVEEEVTDKVVDKAAEKMVDKAPPTTILTSLQNSSLSSRSHIEALVTSLKE